MDTLGKHLYNYRKKNRIVARELAADFGICREYLYDIESGRKVPTMGLAERIAERIGFRIVMIRKRSIRKSA